MKFFYFLFLTILFSFSTFANLREKIDPSSDFLVKGVLYFEKYPFRINEFKDNDYCFFRMSKKSKERTPEYLKGKFYLISLCSINFIEKKNSLLNDPLSVNENSIISILESSKATNNCKAMSGFEVFNTRRYKSGPSVFFLSDKYKKICSINSSKIWLDDFIKLRNLVFLNIKKLNELKYLSNEDYLKIRDRFFLDLNRYDLYSQKKFSIDTKLYDWFLMKNDNIGYISFNDNLAQSVLDFLNDEKLISRWINEDYMNKNRLKVVMESIDFEFSINRAIERIR